MKSSAKLSIPFISRRWAELRHGARGLIERARSKSPNGRWPPRNATTASLINDDLVTPAERASDYYPGSIGGLATGSPAETSQLALAISRSPFGPGQRAIARLTQMFARFDRAPASWVAEQRRVATVSGFLEASLAIIRPGVRPWDK
jgi:hypothetical protein